MPEVKGECGRGSDEEVHLAAAVLSQCCTYGLFDGGSGADRLTSVSDPSAARVTELEDRLDTNTGTETVHLQDFRTGTMLGDRQVAVATDGCWHGSSGDEPVMMGCNRDYRPVTIEAGGTHTFTVTLWRDLAGMNPVGDAPYEWSVSVDRRDTPFEHPDQTGTTGNLLLTYDDLGSTNGATGPDQAGTDEPGGVDGLVLYGPESHLDRTELAKLTGVLGIEDGCLYLQPPPNVRDPLQEPLVWLYGTTWQDDPAGVRLADGRFLPVGALFTAAGGMHSADRLVDLGHAPAVAERAQSCARGDISEIAYIQGEVTIIDSGASAGISVADAENMVRAFLDFADQPSADAAERLPFADQVQLGLGRDLHQSRSATELADPSAWIIDEEYFRAATGPFSALDMAAGSQDTVVSVGEHTHGHRRVRGRTHPLCEPAGTPARRRRRARPHQRSTRPGTDRQLPPVVDRGLLRQ